MDKNSIQKPRKTGGPPPQSRLIWTALISHTISTEAHAHPSGNSGRSVVSGATGSLYLPLPLHWSAAGFEDALQELGTCFVTLPLTSRPLPRGERDFTGEFGFGFDEAAFRRRL